MKKSHLLLIIFTFLFSCTSTRYYYSEVNTENKKIHKTEEGDFIIENDTVSTTYTFNGGNGLVKISIYNKTDQPMYIDWKRSALILNDVAYSYKSDNAQMSGSINGYISSGEYLSGSLQGTVNMPKDVNIIPPKSQVKFSSLKLPGKHKANNNEKQEEVVFERVYDYLTPAKTNVSNYTSQNSPLLLRSYLSMYIGNNFIPFSQDHSFYISKYFMLKGINTNTIKSDFFKKKNVYYITEY